MTIVAVAVAPDGIVLAGDGRATLRGGRRHRIRTDEAQKVFAPYPGVGIATYGSALIGHSTISGLVRSFVARRSSEAGTLADDVAGDLREFAEDAIAAEAKRSGLGLKQVGFLVAGYDGRGVGQVREVVVPGLPNAAAAAELTTDEPGFLFRGNTQYVRRLLEGFDRAAMDRQGIALSAKAAAGLDGLAFIPNTPLTIQDGLDWALFIVRLSIDMDRLTDGTLGEPEGVPSCGGRVTALRVSQAQSHWLIPPDVRPRAAGVAEQG
ncbi:hypothetical protein GKE82_26360 [Conexibacter sp. W3-3-2]|uniref:hypothetical protein n=1 Tax=Conexibacter sp. W3-3-2 TaxID=2675227 RepID=UPI0012B6E877|nr:hypothetical protein [Conexibacter sp. W3-3-2]MTD47640.1 hypothetical protein [Conexibacter sp. W3-3-2]MTD47728.1 hypothetical protein [Conexibacter sp. W3-3-2]